MTQQISSTAIVRQRWQLTIPDSIRERVGWINPGVVVSLATVSPGEIVIRPHLSDSHSVNWAKLWRSIELARSHEGSYKGRLSEFIIEDRKSRR